MKKYLMMFVAAAAFVACSNEDVSDASRSKVVDDYNQAFMKYVGGKIASNQDWGFGLQASSAPAFELTRAVTGITFPDDFSEKKDIEEPGTIEKPTIDKSSATVITETQTWPNQNIDNAVIYVESGVTLTLPDWSALQHTKFYLSSGSTLVAQNLYLKGNTDFVNDGGTITIGSESSTANFVLENLNGTFWNNGAITVYGDFTESNADGCKVYSGSNGSISAKKIYLFKNNLFRNEGNITLTTEFNADQYGHQIYNSGTITTPKIILQKETVLWNEGTITAANGNEIESSLNNDDVQIYNGTSATLKFDTMTLTNNRELVINEGTLNVKGKITTQNNSEIVNYGTLTGGEYEMMSGSKFYNVAGGVVTIDGLSKIANDGSGNNKDNVWLNSGKYTTGSFEATGGCQNPAAFNNCNLKVTGKFFMNHSNFVLDGGAAVECGSFEWESDNYFHMGGKALLSVTGEMLMNNWNTGYGFYGDDTEYAVITAGSIAKKEAGKFRAAYFGNIFVDTDDHFTQGENSADGTWYTFGDNVKFSFTDDTDVTGYQTHGAKTAQKATDFSITIDEDNDGCTPGYTYGGGGGGKTPDIRIIAEDLSATEDSDFDFNDVVFDVTFTSETTATVTLRAAGGTLPLYVAGHEVHAEFGNYSTKTMINTHASRYATNGYAYADNVEPVSFEVTGIDKTKNGSDILIQVEKEGVKYEITAVQGEPAAKLGVDPKFQWVNEKVSLKSVYNAFTGWVANPSVKWY